jgi:hypothetical protein
MPGWFQAADDTLAFRAGRQSVELIPIPGRIRLRTRSAEYFGKTPARFEALPSSSLEGLVPAAIFFLEQVEEIEGENISSWRIDELGGGDALTSLLSQAFVLSLDLPGIGLALTESYMAFANQVAAFRLQYIPEFNIIPPLLDDVLKHAKCD